MLDASSYPHPQDILIFLNTTTVTMADTAVDTTTTTEITAKVSLRKCDFFTCEL